MTPTKIVFQETPKGDLQLRVFAPETINGSTVIESTKRITGKSIPGMRKYGLAYAKRFNIPFIDEVK